MRREAVWYRRIFGLITQILWPSYGWCLRCGVSWKLGTYHITHHSSRRGCFPLCKRCWRQLSPEERLPFYADMVWEWLPDLERDELVDLWESIKSAVMKGK